MAKKKSLVGGIDPTSGIPIHGDTEWQAGDDVENPDGENILEQNEGDARYEPKNSNIQAHIADTAGNPHNIQLENFAEPWQEVVKVTSAMLSQKYIELDYEPFNQVHISIEVGQGSIQYNKKALTAKSGDAQGNFEMDANLPKRLYFDNQIQNFGGEGNEAHTGLVSPLEEDQIIIIKYWRKTI
jgi:hypothetical protein